MKKKLLLGSILAVFMLVTISFASAINTTNTQTTKKESPLYKIRIGRAISEKISQIFENIKTSFLGERLFYLPLFIKKINFVDEPTIYDTKGNNWCLDTTICTSNCDL